MTTQTTAVTTLPRSPRPASTPTQPGPVPMRPLALGEILDNAVNLIRLYPGPTLGLASVLMVIQLVLTLPVQYVSQDFTFSILAPPTAGDSSGPANLLLAVLGIAVSTAVLGVISAVCAGVVSGFTACVVGRAAAAQPVSVRIVWGEVRPRLWPLVGLALMIGVATGLSSLAPLIGPWVVGAAFAVAIPAMMLERVGPFRAIQRAWELAFTSFIGFLRLFWFRLLASFVVAGIWQLLLALPMALVGQAILGLDAPYAPSPGRILLSVFLTGLGTMAAGIMVTPFLGAIDGLLYTDRRMRAEGLDIELGQRLRRAGVRRGEG